jgi:16S rRNA (cytosine1402-N4)-methyltransferase
MVLTMKKPAHIPVLLNEVVEALNVRAGFKYVDCTLGPGGHAQAILDRSGPTGQLLGIDADPEAINLAKENLGNYPNPIILVNSNFVNLESICLNNNFIPVDGILFDLGVSSLQLDSADRGFSFKADAELDMRFSPDQSVTAMNLVNTLAEKELSRIIWEYGEENKSRQIAHLIVKSRPVTDTRKLAQIVEQVAGAQHSRIHPATRTFQALRIAVNSELENLEKALNQTINCLNSGGRLVVISYHSLEDRIVKKFMKHESSECVCPPDVPVCVCNHVPTMRVVDRKIVIPDDEEVKKNPRSRSAKLRVMERI